MKSRWFKTPVASFAEKAKPFIIENDEQKPALIGRRTYDKEHRNLCKALSLTEVYAPKVCRSVIRENSQNGKMCRIDYTSGESPMWNYTEDKIPREYLGKRRFGIIQAENDASFKRTRRMIYLSHVLTQCGIREKAVKPLHRLLRMGFHMGFTNFKRLVNKVACLCNSRHDFTRDIGAPVIGVRSIPAMLESKSLVLKGETVQKWTLTKKFFGNIRALNLD